MSLQFSFAVFRTTVSNLGLLISRKEISQEGMERCIRNEKQKLSEKMKVKLYQPSWCQTYLANTSQRIWGRIGLLGWRL